VTSSGSAIAALSLRLAVASDIDVRFGVGWGSATMLDRDTGIQDGPGWRFCSSPSAPVTCAVA
jgi:hypothetical protein